MFAYIVRRLLQAVVVIFINTILIFALSRLSSDPMAVYANRPGMTAADKERVKHDLGLDQPLPMQYIGWMKMILKGDLGQSLFSRQPVGEMIMQRLPMTLILMVTAEIFIIIFALILSIVAAVKQYSFIDNLITAFSFIGYSLPVFFIGLTLILVFAVLFKQWGLPYLPTGTDVWDTGNPVEMVKHLILPVITLSTISIAGYARFLRSSILEVMEQDYIRTARSKGLSERLIFVRHVLKNAALPFVTILGLDVALMLGGAVVTESVFSWPGMGRLFWEYAQRGDFPVVNGVLLLASTAVVLFTIITDVAYTFIDPRIRLD